MKKTARVDPQRKPHQAIDYNSVDDSALIAALLDRDERAWVALVQRYDPLICAQLARLLDGYALPSDALADVRSEFYLGLLTRNMRHLRACDAARRGLGEWLRLMATWSVLDVLRRMPVGGSK